MQAGGPRLNATILLPIVVIWFGWLVGRYWHHRLSLPQFLLKGLLIGYGYALLAVTLFPLGLAPHWQVPLMNFDLSGGLAYGRLQVVGNLVLLLPLGGLTPLLWRKLRRFPAIIMLLLLTTLGIETLQLVLTGCGLMMRAFDITDLLLNTAGGLCGWALTRAGLHAYGHQQKTS